MNGGLLTQASSSAESQRRWKEGEMLTIKKAILRDGVKAGLVVIAAVAALVVSSNGNQEPTDRPAQVSHSQTERNGILAALKDRMRFEADRISGRQRISEIHRQIRGSEEQTVKMRLSDSCQVEVESITPRVQETRIYVNGALTCRTRRSQPRQGAEVVPAAAVDHSGASLEAVAELLPDAGTTSGLEARRDAIPAESVVESAPLVKPVQDSPSDAEADAGSE